MDFVIVVVVVVAVVVVPAVPVFPPPSSLCRDAVDDDGLALLTCMDPASWRARYPSISTLK